MSELASFVLSGSLDRFQDITSIDDRIQMSRPRCAIFYYLHPDIKSEEKLRTYLNSYKPELLILNRKFETDNPLIVIHEDKWMEIQKCFCDKFYPLPSRPKIIAVTGTNGKTTTADLVLQLASLSSLNAISIGTLGVRNAGGPVEDFGLTTPSFIQLRRILFEYAKDCDIVAMEASSHALDQNRVLGLSFYAGAWT